MYLLVMARGLGVGACLCWCWYLCYGADTVLELGTWELWRKFGKVEKEKKSLSECQDTGNWEMGKRKSSTRKLVIGLQVEGVGIGIS